MKEIYYKNKKKVNNIKNPELFIDYFFKYAAIRLKDYNSNAIISSNILVFDRAKPFTLHDDKGSGEIFKLIYNGKIEIIKSNDQTSIIYMSNFTQILFKSLMIGIISASFYSLIFDIGWLYSLFKVGIIISSPLIAIGFISMKIIIDNIINKCINAGLRGCL